MLTLAIFTHWDWLVLGGYFLLMAAIGAIACRYKSDAKGYFLAERSMPVWAVALSTVATALSVATFTGAPAHSFEDDLTYLSTYIGGFIAALIVAWLFIPRFYRAGTVTIYGYIEQRLGESSRTAVSLMFLVGRMLASGARLFIAAIPVCLLLFGSFNPSRTQLIIAVFIIGAVGIAYIVAGGIRAVIWTDSMQIAIVMGAVLLSIFLLLHKIPLSIGQIVDVLRQPGSDGYSKLRLLDFSWSTDPKHPWTFWASLIGGTCMGVASFGVDHDLAQRMLTAKSPFRGSVSVIAAQCLNIVVVAMFLAVGLLLYIFYRQPELMGTAAPKDVLLSKDQVYPQFLYIHLPAGLAGLAMAGLMAAAQGSLASAINAMASSIVADLYWPLRKRLGLSVDPSRKSKAPRVAVVGVGLLLIGVAVLSVFRYDPKNDTILRFALGVMAFAYSGMLGVFLTALLTRRGSTLSVIASLVVGVLVVTALQKELCPWWTGRVFGRPIQLAEYWWLPIGAALSFVVCLLGRPRGVVER